MAIVATQSSKLWKHRTARHWPGVVALAFFFPIFWMFLTSFKTDADAVKPEYLLFFKPTLENYLNMTENYDYWRFATNSVIVGGFRHSSSRSFVGVPAAYAMAFNPSSRATKDVLMWMLSTKMLPAAAVLYPMTYLTKNFLGPLRHPLPADPGALSLINLPIAIWMLFTYFKEIPKDIIEAGKMDGVNTWGEIREILDARWPGAASPRPRCSDLHLLLERSLLDRASDHHRSGHPVEADRGQPRPRGSVLRPSLGGLGGRGRTDHRTGMVLSETTRPAA